MTTTTIPFSVWKTLGLAASKLKGAKRSILAAYALCLLLILPFELAQYVSPLHISGLGKLIAEILSSILESLWMLGIAYIGVRRAFDLPISYRNLFTVFRVKILLNQLLLGYMLVVIPLGLFLFSIYINLWLGLFSLIPILYGLCRYSMAGVIIIQERVNAFKALNLSAEITKGQVGKLIGLFIIQFLLFLIALIPLGIGLIWVLPLNVLYWGETYKALLLNSKDSFTS